MHRGNAERMAGTTASTALAAAVSQGYIGEPETLTYESGKTQPVALFYDLDEFEANIGRAKDAFGEGCLHAIAVKANPVPALLNIVKEKSEGAECASIGEVLSVLRVGFQPEKIVYDSPVKTRPELRFLLEKGVHVNVDSLQELDVITEVIKEVKEVKSTIGLRVNPVMAVGDIKALSVSCLDSKFAVPLTDATRVDIIEWFVQRPWLTCVHVHIGSQSYGVDGLSEGARRAVDLALDVNAKVGRSQVDVIDIGGGMGVNRTDESITPTFYDYVSALKKIVPELFPGKGVFKKVITEFGQALNAKTGFIASRVEYTKTIPHTEHTIALMHAGADLCMRSCYCPDVKKYQRRVQVFDSTGRPKTGDEKLHNIAGPLCFAGDVVRKEVMLPQIERGDIVVLHDCGANSLATFSRHCSRFAPSVIGYRILQGKAELQVLKEAETFKELFRFWQGGKH